MWPGAIVRPELRRPRLAEVLGYRVVAELNDSEPLIWRTLEMPSDLGLGVLHEVLQEAFGWNDSHLHRFAVGGSPFDRNSQVFLCPYDVVDGDEQGPAEESVRLDEVLQEPGDALEYVYDYGDNWDLTIRLDAVLPEPPQGVLATCVDGRRAAPPDDCGGRRTAEQLAEVLEDPARFDVREVNASLLRSASLLSRGGVEPSLIRILKRLRFTPVGDTLLALRLALQEDQLPPNQEEFDDLLGPVRWFLQRAEGDGLPLTAAGYLKPADVEAACEVLPGAQRWIGKKNREDHTAPVLWFRETLQALGLLRKNKGRLLITKAGRRGLADPGSLVGHIASRLVPERTDYEQDAALLTLLWATSESVSVDVVPESLMLLGWQRKDGTPLSEHEVRGTWPAHVLRQLAPTPWTSDDPFIRSAGVRALARAALLPG